MQNSKIIRIFLLSTSLILAYLLFLQWNAYQEKINKNSQINSQTNPILETTSTQNNDAVYIPQRIENKNSKTDVPVVSRSIVPIKEATTSSIKENTVTIKTDEVIAVIDLNGGDLIHLELLEYSTSNKDSKPFKLLLDENNMKYVVSNGFIGKDGIDSTKARARYTSEKSHYEIQNDRLEVVLEHKEKNKIMQKIFVFKKGSYVIEQQFIIKNISSSNLEVAIYNQIKRNSFKIESQSAGIGVSSYTGFAVSTPDDSYAKHSFSDLESQNIYISKVSGGWISLIQRYFATAIIPSKNTSNSFYSKHNDGTYMVGYVSGNLVVAPEETKVITSSIYSGPKIKKNLISAEENLDLTIDYGWFWFISEILMWILLKIQLVITNWGFAIIALTVIVRLMFYVPTRYSFYSMAKMRLAMPKIQILKEKYASDKQGMSKAMIELYKKEKINPLGGCLPMLLQMPVFIALYWGLLESVELRHQPFMLWIQDLSAPDSFFILPILMGITFYLQQKLSPQSATMDPNMQAIMKWIPVLFTVMFLWLPSGLVLYFVTSNTWSIAQQYLITKQLENKENNK